MKVSRIGLGLLGITLAGLGAALFGQWSNHSRNGLTIAEDERAPPTGPSTVIRGIRRRAEERQARERRAHALAVEALLRADGGAP
jgi:hypothetical protein